LEKVRILLADDHREFLAMVERLLAATCEVVGSVPDGQSAAAQFQKLIDNPGFSVRHVIGPLDRLQLGRAQVMGDDAATRKSYEIFLDLWKNADPDIPIYQQAKAEYAKLGK
jgi:CheY-like chemotaxis protein